MNTKEVRTNYVRNQLEQLVRIANTFQINSVERHLYENVIQVYAREYKNLTGEEYHVPITSSEQIIKKLRGKE